MKTIQIEDISILLERKLIRSIRLSVKPDGSVQLRIPFFVSEQVALDFVRSKWSWLLRTRERVLSRAQRPPLQYTSGETHYLFGEPYTLQIQPVTSGTNSVELADGVIIMHCRPTTTLAGRQALLQTWYRAQLRTVLSSMMEQWTARLCEPDTTWTIRRMRSEWGSCAARKRHILFNLELARVPLSCIEYIVVHELTHLAVQNHGPAFKFLMTQRLPQWPQLRKQLKDAHALA